MLGVLLVRQSSQRPLRYGHVPAYARVSALWPALESLQELSKEPKDGEVCLKSMLQA